MKAHKGAHQLERFKTANKRIIFKCMIPGCTSYFTKELALNRMSRCPVCGTEFALTKENITLKKPLCKSCREARAEMRGKTYAEIMEENL